MHFSSSKVNLWGFYLSMQGNKKELPFKQWDWNSRVNLDIESMFM